MSRFSRALKTTTLPLLIVLCLAALTVSYAYAEGSLRPLATQIIGDPDAAVAGKLAVGTATPGNKALTVVGVIDFLGAGTVHNYFTQGAGNNLQLNTNVDEANTVLDATKSQWKLVMGSSLDWFSIRRSPAGATYNEDALFFIQGSTGNVGIATVDTGNGGAIPLTPEARLHVETDSGWAIVARTTDPDFGVGVSAESSGTSGVAVWATASSTSGSTYGLIADTLSPLGTAVYGEANATTGASSGVRGVTNSPDGYGVRGSALNTTGSGTGVSGYSGAPSGFGVYGVSFGTSGTGVFGEAQATTGTTYALFGRSFAPSGTGVFGHAAANSGTNYGVYGRSSSTSGYGVYFQGGLAGTGVKSAIVETDDFGWRHLYAMESPQNWFEDFGQATLVAGEVVVPIEEVFAQTVNLDEDYHVFLTPLGDCPLYVAEKSDSSFTVRAHEGADCETSFDFRVIAPRLDFEDLRLKEADDPEAVAAAMPEPPPAPAAQ